MNLWPRLPLPRGRALAAAFAHLDVQELENRAIPSGADRLYAPTGGAPVSYATLLHLRAEIEALAKQAGYPEPAGKQGNSRFDHSALRFFADLAIPFGEALRAETWAWICVVLLPHVAKWRWPGTDGNLRLERFAGPLVRNCFGRLWYQAHSLDRGTDCPPRWAFADALGADQAVALFERPSLAANPDVCRTIARHWAMIPRDRRKEEMFREAMKALVVRAAYQRFDVLPKQTLERVVAQCFSRL
jgi:hypothetical protein